MALIDVNGKRFKNFMTKLYGLGAAVVIIGALLRSSTSRELTLCSSSV